MRVADRSISRNYMKHMHRSLQNYMETNERIASGKRFTKLSDDVSAGARVLRIRMDRYKAEKQVANVQEANDRLLITEDNMLAINQILTAVHENKVVRALNDPVSDEGRLVLASEIKSMLEEFLQYANASYGKQFNIGGTNAYTGPFTVGEDGYLLYNGIAVDDIQSDAITGDLYYDKPQTSVIGGAIYTRYEVRATPGTYVYKGADNLYYNDNLDDTVTLLATQPAPIEVALMTDKTIIPMDDDIYYDIGLGITMSGNEVNHATAFRVSYSGLEVTFFGKDNFGMSNNLYNIMYNIANNIESFEREEVEKWNTKLRAQMDTYRVNLTDIGVKTKFLEAAEQSLNRNIDSYTNRIYTLMGVYDAEEATNQMMNDYVYKAVLQLGSRILPLSLMDFVR